LTGSPAVLVLENGIIFNGTSIGAEKLLLVKSVLTQA
jgi:hypothetical protein